MQRLADVDALEALAPEWSRLAEECPWASPFQLPEWLLPYCRVYRPRPWGLALREGGELTGLALLEERGEDDGPVRVWLGTGPSDYLDLLARPGREEALWQALLAALAEDRGAWTACRLEELSPESPLPGLAGVGSGPTADAGDAAASAAGARPGGLDVRVEDCSRCPSLDLSAATRLDDAIPAAAAARLAYARRRVEREGDYRVIDGGSDWQGPLEALVELHRERWQAAGQEGVLWEDTVRFHRRVAAGFAARGALALHELRLDGAPLAAFYGLRQGTTLYYYLGGFDPARGTLSPGWLAVGHAIEQALASGCRRFDFLRGEERYKERWGARPRTSRRVVLTAGRP